jgi:hypothetical protein
VSEEAVTPGRAEELELAPDLELELKLELQLALEIELELSWSRLPDKASSQKLRLQGVISIDA